MFKRKRGILAVAVFLVLFTGVIGCALLFTSRDGDIRIAGNLDEKELKEIKGVVHSKMRSRRMQHVWDMAAQMNFTEMPERILRDSGFRIDSIYVRTNGNVKVYVEHDDILDAGWTYEFARTNGWKIVDEHSHSP